jgi:hypothetical protein
MIKGLIYGLIGGACALVGYWAADAYRRAPSSTPAVEATKPYAVRKAGTLNVPVLRGGKIHGYIVVRFAYALDREIKEPEHLAVESLLHDEAFRVLYSDQHVDFRTIEKYDIAGLKQKLLERLRSRLSSDSVQDVLISEFSFVPVSALR